MTKISAKIVADSISEQGHRITTMELVFPRFILAELNTHRLFSKNSASSRAIPFEKMLKEVTENPFIPIAWQKDHKGMQGSQYFENKIDIIDCEHAWLGSRDYAVQQAILMSEKGVTKQIVNRLLEPFMWHKVLLTSTEFENFFNLRCPKYTCQHGVNGEDNRPHITYPEFKSKNDFVEFANYHNYEIPDSQIDWLKLNKGQAEIHMMQLAEFMYDAMRESSPKLLEAGEWHIPYFDADIEDDQIILLGFAAGEYLNKNGIRLDLDKSKLMVASARCARLSYQTLGDDAKIDFSKDLVLHDNLLSSKHMSPFEHCARAMSQQEVKTYIKGKVFVERLSDDQIEDISYDEVSFGWSRNFRGFTQYREILESK